jgi:hypothetical protein
MLAAPDGCAAAAARRPPHRSRHRAAGRCLPSLQAGARRGSEPRLPRAGSPGSAGAPAVNTCIPRRAAHPSRCPRVAGVRMACAGARLHPSRGLVGASESLFLSACLHLSAPRPVPASHSTASFVYHSSIAPPIRVEPAVRVGASACPASSESSHPSQSSIHRSYESLPLPGASPASLAHLSLPPTSATPHPSRPIRVSPSSRPARLPAVISESVYPYGLSSICSNMLKFRYRLCRISAGPVCASAGPTHHAGLHHEGVPGGVPGHGPPSAGGAPP